MPDTILPQKVTDTSVVCPSTPASKGTRGVYTIIAELDQKNQPTGRAFKLQTFRGYMQQNVTDENRPDGHMTTEWGIRTDLTWNPPHNKIAEDTGILEIPFPCIMTWWRALLDNPNNYTNYPDDYKMSTKYYQVGYADTGQDAIFEQHVC